MISYPNFKKLTPDQIEWLRKAEVAIDEKIHWGVDEINKKIHPSKMDLGEVGEDTLLINELVRRYEAAGWTVTRTETNLTFS